MIDKTYIIGEIGINHNGEMSVVKKLIDIASVAGFDAVKFQKRTPDICVPEHQKSKLRDTPWGTMSYLNYKKKIEFGYDEYLEIDSYCKEKNIEWSASPWDCESASFLADFNIPWVKIASASITDHDLVKTCASFFNKLIISTGMSNMSHVEHAVQIAIETNPQCELIIMHCNSSYPAPVDELNLNVIKTLSVRYPEVTIGYSGHEYGLVTTMATVAMGARCIERHITLDKGMWGSDQSCSLEPHAMFKLVRGIRELEQALGSYEKVITPGELEKMKTLRNK